MTSQVPKHGTVLKVVRFIILHSVFFTSLFCRNPIVCAEKKCLNSYFLYGWKCVRFLLASSCHNVSVNVRISDIFTLQLTGNTVPLRLPCFWHSSSLSSRVNMTRQRRVRIVCNNLLLSSSLCFYYILLSEPVIPWNINSSLSKKSCNMKELLWFLWSNLWRVKVED